MKQIILNTEIHKFSTCREFVREFVLGEGDLILTNEYIYRPYFEELDTKADVLFQEKYGVGEPTDVMVDAIRSEMKQHTYKRLIAVGGGTIIDIAKVLSVAGDKSIDELYERTDLLEKQMELILVPTTCGTGSEVTNISILNRTSIHIKQGLVSDSMYADQAALIPELLRSLPFPVFAASSIDALVHAVESILSPKATAYTKLFGYKAVELIIKGYQKIAADGRECLNDLLEDFLIAANYAGISFGTAGCAAVHALSYPLGSKYHVPHGESNYAIFTGVLNHYMGIKHEGEIACLNQVISNYLSCEPDFVYKKLEELLDQILVKKALREYGMQQDEIEIFSEAVMTTQGRLMANNFTALDKDDVKKIYSELF